MWLHVPVSAKQGQEDELKKDLHPKERSAAGEAGYTDLQLSRENGPEIVSFQCIVHSSIPADSAVHLKSET